MGFRNLYGIDPSEDCVKNSSRVLPGRVQRGTFSSFPTTGPYKGILMSHVLEHIKDLRMAMDVVAKNVQEEGWIYVEVPDASRYGDFLASPFQDFNLEHINHFSLESLANLMRITGFDLQAQGEKTIFAARGVPYPAIWGMGVKSTSNLPLISDFQLRGSLERYDQLSSRYLEKLDTQLKEWLSSCPQILVWGTGQLLFKLLQESSLRVDRVRAFIDRNPVHHGKKIRGIPVISPDEVSKYHEPILVGSTVNHESILADIKTLRLSNRILTLIQNKVL